MIKAGLNSDRKLTELGLVDKPELNEPISISRRIILAGALSSLVLGALGIRYSLQRNHQNFSCDESEPITFEKDFSGHRFYIKKNGNKY